MNKSGPYPCVCCGYMVLPDRPGSHQICPICGWQDDIVQLRWPTYTGGANRTSLAEAQVNYRTYGAKDRRSATKVRKVLPDDQVEPGFRQVDLAVDSFELPDEVSAPWPSDPTDLYWWREKFWRRGCS